MAFFRRSAHRFFIAIDNRLLPSGVRPPRLRFFEVVPPRLPDRADPRSAVIALPSRSRSFFKSATNFSRSKVLSFGALAALQLAPFFKGPPDFATYHCLARSLS